MISFLRGKPVSFGNDHLIMEVGGIGYKVLAPTPVLGRLTERDEQVVIHTYMYVREDVIQLFGFIEESDRRIFELLIQVSGIGPKVALAVLSSMNVPVFVQAVVNEQINMITQIPGVGKKMAQRIIVELKDKFSKIDVGINDEKTTLPAGLPDVTGEALQALAVLGYNPAEAKRALSKIVHDDTPSPGLEDMVKLALKELVRY